MNALVTEFYRVLKLNGKILIVVKKGDTEGYVDELEGFKTRLYFTHFKEEEIENYLRTNGFKVIFLETRQPYDFEIPVERIYAIGEKISR
jgi:hypothetical protein